MDLRAGSSTDLVLHLPAATGGDPVVDVYRSPLDPIAPEKARILLAHTATVPPADVQVDGETVFENIANGEYVVADLPAGSHSAAIVPAGEPNSPLLGPLDVTLPAGTLTLVYAVGTPTDGSMTVISHQERLAADGSVAPTRVETGTAGLVAGVRVVPVRPVLTGRRCVSVPLLLAVAAVALTACDQAPQRAVVTPSEQEPSHLTARDAERTGPRAEPPTGVRLPSGVRVPVRPADTRPDGLLDVPDDVRMSGWWRGGSRLGDPFGSTLLAGHVDSAVQGLGPYAELLTVRPGDRVVIRSAHLRQVFAVAALRAGPTGLAARPPPCATPSTARAG